eukprot:m.26958 g.26958  ORF g.26958 m.26958 type:complete len:412 (+) comp5901_c2_seq3:109-1344(+)
MSVVLLHVSYVVLFASTLLLFSVNHVDADLFDKEVDMEDDDMPYFKSHYVMEEKGSDHSPHISEPGVIAYHKPAYPTTSELRSKRIAVATVAAPPLKVVGSNFYIFSACLMFESFRNVTHYQNVDYIVIVRNLTWSMNNNGKEIARKCGIKLVERPLFIKYKEARENEQFYSLLHDRLAAGIGLLDYDFLWPWSFEQYEKVLVLDTDVHINRNIDHLFTPDVDMVFTSGPRSRVNGGFQLIRPNRDTLLHMKKLILTEGGFSKESGWFGKGTLPDKQLGAMTLQGFLTYYFHFAKPPSHSLQLSRHMYNFQFDKESMFPHELECATIYFFHFTACTSPQEYSEAFFLQWRAGRQPVCKCAFFRTLEFYRWVLTSRYPTLAKHFTGASKILSGVGNGDDDDDDKERSKIDES